MTTPIPPQPPPPPPPKDPAVVVWGNKLGEAKDKLQDPNMDPNELVEWLEQMMMQGQGLPAWANSISGQQFAEQLKAPNIDQEFLVQIIDNWLQSQGISPPTPPHRA